jgi:subtilisin family serine protease
VQTRRTTLLLLLIATFGSAASRKVAPDLARVAPDQTVNVIVRYTHPPLARHHATMANRGAKLRHSLEVVNSAAYSMPASALADLENDPEIEYVAPDRPVSATLDYANPTVNASIARQYGWDGTGVTVAVIDSGIMDTHPDVRTSNGVSRVIYSESFNLSEGNDPFDRYGHGTHVSAMQRNRTDRPTSDRSGEPRPTSAS